MKQLFSLANKVIIITGATGVLGEAFVHAVAEMGGKVVLVGRNEEVGNARAEELNARR
jgi:NADP-dependent 3-hydroxy acid dehydrogenase YdfG